MNVRWDTLLQTPVQFRRVVCLTSESGGRISRDLASMVLVSETWVTHEPRTRKTRPTVKRLCADRQRMPGSWERSRLRRYRSSASTDPPEPNAPEGFLLSASHGMTNWNSRRQAGTGDPDPGARAETRVPKRAGPAGGNEAMSRTPMAERTLRGSQISGASKAPQKNFGLPRRSRGSNQRWW